MEIPIFDVDDVLILKKPHPCGSSSFKVLRVGSDIRIKCNQCGRDLEISREKLEKRIKTIRRKA